MKLKFHHLNLCTSNVATLDEFYRGVLGLDAEPTLGASRIASQGYAGRVSFVTDGAAQFHLSQRDLDVGFRTKQAINPLERGHIAFRTNDIEAVKRRLAEKGVLVSDYGTWAMSGWHQIFFHDPDGNVIEVHQDKS